MGEGVRVDWSASRRRRVSLLLATAFCGLMSPHAFAAPPGSDDPAYCGARQDSIDCAQVGAPNADEAAFVARARGHVPGSDDQILKIGRGTCFMVRQGDVTTLGIVKTIAGHTGQSEAGAGQVLALAMDTACQGYTVAANGTTRPRDSTDSGAGGTAPAPSGRPLTPRGGTPPRSASYLAGLEIGAGSQQENREAGAAPFAPSEGQQTCQVYADNAATLKKVYWNNQASTIPASEFNKDDYLRGCLDGMRTG